MRLFFLMLLLLNGAFFAVNALREPKPPNLLAKIDSATPQLALLSEEHIAEASSIEKEAQNTAPKKPQEPALDLKTWLAKFTAETESISPPKELSDQEIQNKIITTQCYTAGPFQNTEHLQQATRFFSDKTIEYKQRSIVENHYIGMLVYIPSLPDRKSVVALAETLAAKGVKDYMLLNEPGKKHSLSLGVYGLKKNAEQRIKILAKLKYKAQSEARYRKKTINWLDYSLDSKKEQTDLSAQFMKSLNVSQIERNCKS